jgi:hypothetical protein
MVLTGAWSSISTIFFERRIFAKASAENETDE